ncbi:hypothetical protein FRC09_000868 [Ceratobasidium sp. 395]|nr:hypothetical protein FRC09_000868 [Ceratobasidium sp. 395]
MATVDLSSWAPRPRTHWEDDSPESSPLLSPDTPVFLALDQPDLKSSEQNIEITVPRVRLPSALFGESLQEQETRKNASHEFYLNPTWKSYRSKYDARLSRHLNQTSSDSSASSLPSATLVRADEVAPNGAMSISSAGNGGLATSGTMGQWKPTPMSTTSRSRSHSQHSNHMVEIPFGLTPTSSGSTNTQNRQNWNTFRRQNQDLFTTIQQAVDKVEKFHGTNYPSWSYWFKRKVLSVPPHNVWGHITGSRPRPTPTESSITLDEETGTGRGTLDPVERWDMDEAAIYCALVSVIHSSVARDQVEGCTTAKQLWDKLELVYGDPDISATNAANIIRELSLVTYTPGDDLLKHLLGMQSLVDQLWGGPYCIPESLLLWFIYDSMPGCFAAEIRELRKENLSMSMAIERLKAIGEEVLGDQSKARGVGYRQTVMRGRALPLDLRYYKYHGDGETSDGQLYQRAEDTCSACLGTGHKAYSKECPQTEVRLGLWGRQFDPMVVGTCLRVERETVDQHRVLGFGGLPEPVRMVRTIGTGPSRRPRLNPNWRGA